MNSAHLDRIQIEFMCDPYTLKIKVRIWIVGGKALVENVEDKEKIYFPIYKSNIF